VVIKLSSLSRISDAHRSLSRPRLSGSQLAYRRKLRAEFFGAQHDLDR